MSICVPMDLPIWLDKCELSVKPLDVPLWLSTVEHAEYLMMEVILTFCMDWCCQYGPNCLFKIDLCWITYVVDYLKKWMPNLWMCQYGCLHGSCWMPVADNPRLPMDFILYNVPVTSTTQPYISGRPFGSGWTAAPTLRSKMNHETWVMQIERFPLVVKTFVQ